MHLYFLRPSGPLTSTRLPGGIDLKANGYCILPPSPHPVTGRPYVWSDALPVTLPGMARAALLPPAPARRPARERSRTGDGAGEALARFVAESEPGERNTRLFWAACRAHKHHDAQTLAALADMALRVGLSEVETARTIASAARKVGTQ